jgi:Phospholipase B
MRGAGPPLVLEDASVVLVEQMPGKVVSEDITPLVRDQRYFPSYNIPYSKAIFDGLGYDTHGYNYSTYPRARIFRGMSHGTLGSAFRFFAHVLCLSQHFFFDVCCSFLLLAHQHTVHDIESK